MVPFLLGAGLFLTGSIIVELLNTRQTVLWTVLSVSLILALVVINLYQQG